LCPDCLPQAIYRRGDLPAITSHHHKKRKYSHTSSSTTTTSRTRTRDQPPFTTDSSSLLPASPQSQKIKEISDTIPVQRAEPQDWNTVFATNGMDLVLRNCITLIEVRTYVWFDTNLFWAFIFLGEGPSSLFLSLPLLCTRYHQNASTLLGGISHVISCG
jgi:hypothetical protein